LRSIARATDSPSDVLPTPGGPTRASTAPERRPPTTPRPRSLRPLAHRQVLDDPVLDVIEPGVVLVEDPPCAGDVVGVLGPLVPRDVEMVSSQVPDPADFRRLVRGPLELVDLAHRGLVDLLRQVGRLHPAR